MVIALAVVAVTERCEVAVAAVGVDLVLSC